MDDIAVICSEGEGRLVQEAELGSSEEAMTEKAVIEIELGTEARGVWSDRFHASTAIGDGYCLSSTRLIQPACEDIHSSWRTCRPFLEEGIPEADIDIAQNDR